jgi:flagellar basal body P-ring formation protein FlgA
MSSSRSKCRRLLPVLWTAIASTAVIGANFERVDVETLRRLAQHAALRQLAASSPATGTLSVEAGHIDPRLQLPVCAMPLQAHLLDGTAPQSRHIVEVRCPVDGGWRTRIPVAVSVEATVLVARRSLPRGAPLQAADFATTRRRIPGTAADLVAPADMPLDRRLARPVAVGTFLSHGMLDRELAVHRGQQVTLLARTPTAEIRASGLALADARPGERVRARNLSSQRVIEGVAGASSIIVVQP